MAASKNNLTGLQLRHAGAQWWVAACLIVVVNAATLIGNVAVMVGLCRVRRAPSHYPLTSLVAADLLVGLAVQPIAAATELFVLNLNQYICGFWSTMDVLCCTASILSLCALGWERWAGITAPLAKARRSRRARILAYSVWPVSALVALPNALTTSPHHFDPGKLDRGCPVNVNTGYVFFSITLSFYLPAVLLVVMYACVLRALAAPPPIRAHRGRSPAPKIMMNPAERNNNSENAAAFIQRQRQATRTIVTLMGMFLVCWTPYFIILPLDSLYDCVTDGTWLWCTWLGYANSALNPLVYATWLRTCLAKRISRFNKNTLPLAPRA